jgi:hypothetical protein
VHGGGSRRRPASTDEIERPAHRGRGLPPGVEAAIDFDPLRQLRIDQRAVEGTVGKPERQPIEQQRDAATRWRALQARAADRQARRFETAKAFLHAQASSVAEKIRQGAGIAAGPLVAGHDLRSRGAGAVVQGVPFHDPRRQVHGGLRRADGKTGQKHG